jgi:DNA polymerase ligase (LigD)-like protein
MKRFVILEHDHPTLHWDLMLEADNSLQTWRLAVAPQPDIPIEATALGDHRLAYLDYEGPVSGNRGVVRRWDAGDYDEVAESAEVRRLVLRGKRVRGAVLLTKQTEANWSFVWLSTPERS